jgi:6-pyruvoyltetrahydropterin/6-carboxytetrahydropterin synthase
MVSVCKIFTFSAGHCLPNHKGKCKNFHGHNYKLEVEIKGNATVPQRSPYGLYIGDVHDADMVMDFGHLSIIVQGIIDMYDHKTLNNFWVNPTAEIMVKDIANKIYLILPRDVDLIRVRLWETDTCYAECRDDHGICKLLL